MSKFGGWQREASASSATGDSSSEASPRASKRRKTDDQEQDQERVFRQNVVTQIRSKWLEKLNFGRSGVRKYLYMELVCVLDRIATYKSVSVARTRGYEIILHGSDSDMEDIERDTPNLDRSIWNIPDAHVDGTAASDAKNMELRRKLAEKFPSLHATVCYKVRVHSVVDESDPGYNPDAHHTARIDSRREKISLHAVAQGVLMEIYGADSLEKVLSVSQLSLKAVHVIALAIRGLVVHVLDKFRDRRVELSASEAAAFGSDVSLNDKTKIMVLMDKVLPDGKMNKVYSDCYAAKFETTEARADEEAEPEPDVEPVRVTPGSAEMLFDGDWTRHK